MLYEKIIVVNINVEFLNELKIFFDFLMNKSRTVYSCLYFVLSFIMCLTSEGLETF